MRVFVMCPFQGYSVASLAISQEGSLATARYVVSFNDTAQRIIE